MQEIPNERALLTKAAAGDESAFSDLVQPVRRPLFSYVYRMVANHQDAEDLVQEVMIRVLKNLPSFRAESKFQTWIFGIATHVCLDYLKSKKRWRVEAQLTGEQEAKADPSAIDRLTATMSQPDFVFEIREHIAFCFSCIGRTLSPEEQAAIMLKEVLGFTNEEAAKMLEVSEPVFRHRLSSARKSMIESYEGLCRLVSKTGRCYQCRDLREIAPEGHRGPDMVQIEVAPGKAVSPENLFDARLEILKDADLEEGPTHTLHQQFFISVGGREEGRQQ